MDAYPLTATCTSRCVRAGGTRATGKLVFVLVLACVNLAGAGLAIAEDPRQLLPEVAAFKQLNDRWRAFVDAAYALGNGSESVDSLDVAAFLDVSLKPFGPMRRQRLSNDWQRNRYLWTRIGYDRIYEATDSSGLEAVEDRGVIAVYGRIPIPKEIWLEARSRVDFRKIGDESSKRYRFRIDASRELTIRDHTVAPYINFEWFYDTRYEDWARTLGTLGAEITATEHFRYEIYIARQADLLPEKGNLNALGIVFKWFY